MEEGSASEMLRPKNALAMAFLLNGSAIVGIGTADSNHCRENIGALKVPVK